MILNSPGGSDEGWGFGLCMSASEGTVRRWGNIVPRSIVSRAIRNVWGRKLSFLLIQLGNFAKTQNFQLNNKKDPGLYIIQLL